MVIWMCTIVHIREQKKRANPKTTAANTHTAQREKNVNAHLLNSINTQANTGQQQ